MQLDIRFVAYGQTDVTKLTVTCHNFTEATKFACLHG